MKLKFTFFNLFFGCISLLIINTKFNSNVIAEGLLKVELNTEIKKGRFLIGLKQYLGGEKDSFSKKKNINFKTNKGFLNLVSSNGIKLFSLSFSLYFNKSNLLYAAAVLSWSFRYTLSNCLIS